MNPGRLAEGELGAADAAFPDVAREVLRQGHAVRFHAPGTSMVPTIREGETITVAPVRPEAIRLWDIVLFDSPRGITAHRVMAVTHESGERLVFVTRGDAYASCDQPVGAESVLGRVVVVERDGRAINLAGRRGRVVGAARSAAARLARRLYARLAGR